MRNRCVGSRRGIVCGALAVLIGMVSSGFVSPPAAAQKDQDLSAFMRKKLDASSMILEGMAVEDASLIKKGALTMLEMSKAEMWNIFTDDEYRDHNREFRAAIRKLHAAASDENFDNVTLQWFDAVKGCVECHKHVRHTRRGASK